MSLPQPDDTAAEPLSEVIPPSSVDSAIEDNGSSRHSLSSEVTNYQFENGRRYHGYHAGKYPLPNDDKEQERLDFMHMIYLLVFDNKLVLHPRTRLSGRVLDLGTGTGIWAMDYADEHPDAHVIGVDLSPIQDTWLPPNCEFEVDDIEEEWTWHPRFSSIFCRGLSGSILDLPALVRQAFDNLEPGGYFEIQDCSFEPFSNDGNKEFETTFFHDWWIDMARAAEISGRRIDDASSWANALRDTGFDMVTTERRPVPIGGWPKDKKLRLIGSMMGEMLTTHLDGISSALFTRHLAFTTEEVSVYLARVRKDLKEHRHFPLSTMYAVWGRKPLDTGL